MTRLPQWQRLITPPSAFLPRRSPPNITTADFRRHHAQTPARTTTKTQHVFPTNRRLQCMQCMSRDNTPKMPFRKHKNDGTCMSCLQTNKRNCYGHIPRVQGWTVLSFQGTFLWVSVSAVWREYTKHPAKTPAPFHIHFPSFALVDRTTWWLSPVTTMSFTHDILHGSTKTQLQVCSWQQMKHKQNVWTSRDKFQHFAL